MKKLFSFILCSCLVSSLTACGGTAQPAETQPQAENTPGAATAADIAFLDKAYEGRAAYHGEFHDHADTGGTSDGKQNLTI